MCVTRRIQADHIHSPSRPPLPQPQTPYRSVVGGRTLACLADSLENISHILFFFFFGDRERKQASKLVDIPLRIPGAFPGGMRWWGF